MRRNAAFLRLETTLAWLGQFDPVDQPIAIELLQELQLVSRDTFADRLRDLILRRMNEGPGPIGLYAEREIPLQNGVPNRLFKEPRRKVKRAYGLGPLPVRPTKLYDPSVGSEGIVAQLVSELCRQFPSKLINHPGPERIREKRIRRFFLVTDFIGSGRRAKNYLQAAWRVRSVRSWWSARKSKGMAFEVVAYSATQSGFDFVKAHASAPSVFLVTSCLSIPEMERTNLGGRLRHLCVKYDPINQHPYQSLGFEGAGALIAFAHGAPNNTPRLLYTRSSTWEPLFPKRITAGSRQTFSVNWHDREEIRGRLIAMRQKRLAAGGWMDTQPDHARVNLTVLAALSHPPRTDETLSRRTGLTILDIQNALAVAMSNKWIDDARRLTDRGQAELASARKNKTEPKVLPAEPEIFYYPKSLRAP